MSKRKKRLKPLTTREYLRLVKQNSDLVPSQRKYKRRVKLNRWEKGAITKAANNVARAGSHKTLFPLSKSQARAIKDKSLIVRRGIRGVRINNPVRDTEIHIIDGELEVQQNGRLWHSKSLPPDIDLIDAAIEILFITRKITFMSMLTTNGRSDIGDDTPEGIISQVASYLEQYADFDQWFVGVTWYYEPD
ncbi:hypothetical protein LCGC14_0838110 [marine sediment metagenome]|uniref:Uncharacterized protein n=1 Tax=marine sediment metagenome TaxID=412755 RepID=A0A0F9SL91_9ZZZZ